MLEWLFGRPRFRVYEDSFARTRRAMLLGLKDAIATRMEQDQNVLLVTHFADPFAELQDSLSESSIEYTIGPSRISPHDVLPLFQGSEQLVLCLADQLRNDEVKPEPAPPGSKTTCVVVTERHPNGRSDDALESFCRSMPGHVEFGYFMSFEDVTVGSFLNEAALQILDLFGLGENELVTSNMISRRLKFALRRNARTVHSDQPADSAKEWIELNVPPEPVDE